MIKTTLYIFLLGTFSFFSTTVVERLTWNDMADVTFDYRYSDEYEVEVPYPIFGEGIKAFDGKEVIVKGFYVPLEAERDQKQLILSKYTYEQCFFCGGAGPESVMDIKPLKPINALTLNKDEQLTFKGTLRLNGDNFDDLYYILEKAELMDN